MIKFDNKETITIKDFFKKYPNCPLCSEPISYNSSEKIRIYGIVVLGILCKKDHFEVCVNRKNYSKIGDANIESIHFITDKYDISIILKDNWIRIGYGHPDAEISFDCDDFEKWMLSHDKMIDKLEKLFVLK